MAPQTRSDRPLPRRMLFLWVVCFAVIATTPALCQQIEYSVSVTHPGGLTRLVMENPELILTQPATTTAPAQYVYRPAGRFQLWTGPAAPIGGDPTRVGDEDRNIASIIQGGSYAAQLSSKTTIAIDPELIVDDDDLGYLYDIHDLMAQQDDGPLGSLTNFWIATPTVGTRDIVGTYRLPAGFDEEDEDIVTAWIEVRQTLTLIGDTLQVENIVYNTSGARHRIGVRVVFDGTFGTASIWDGQAIILPDGSITTTEMELPDQSAGGGLLPDTWVTYDDPLNPNVAIRGVVRTDDVLDPGAAGFSAGLPDSVAWGQMRNIGLTNQYYYTPNRQAPLVNEDWGYAVKWEPIELSPGHSCRFVTYFGVGSSTPDYERPYGLMTYAPFSLVQQQGDDPSTPDVVEDYYLTDAQGNSPFPVSAYMDNFGSEPMLDASVRIRLPLGLELAPGESLTKSVGVIKRNELRWATWLLRATAARPGRYSIKFTGPRGKVLERAINIPALPILNPLESPRGLEMVSIPYEFNNTDAEWVFQDLGSLQPGGNATIVRWDPSTGEYRWFPDPSTTTIEPGIGFWLLNLTREAVKLPPDATLVDAQRTYSVRIPPGWSQIGNPFAIPVRLDQVRVIGPAGGEWSMEEAYNRLLLVPTVFEYNPTDNDYDWATNLGDARMDPYRGYWILSYENVTLQFPPPSLFSPAAAVEDLAVAVADDDEWAVQLAVSAASQVRSKRAFGVCGGAKNGYDRNDLPQPPVATSDAANALAAAFVCGDGTAAEAGLLLVDKRPAKARTTWRLAVTSGAAGQDVTVHWGDLSEMPGELIGTLVDTATGKRCYMRTASAYTYRTVGARETRILEIVVRRRGAGTLSVSSLNAQQARGGQVAITYGLSVPAEVEILIRNISGVPIGRAASAGVSPEGTSTVVWSGQSSTGTPVPAGCYICHVTARCPDTGQVANIMRTFNIRR